MRTFSLPLTRGIPLACATLVAAVLFALPARSAERPAGSGVPVTGPSATSLLSPAGAEGGGAGAAVSAGPSGTAAGPSLATKPSTTEGAEGAPSPGGPGGIVDWLHGSVSEGLLASATWLDSFFGNERYYEEVNRSYLRVSYQILNETWDWTRYRPDYQLRLVLPQLRRKTRLVLEGDFRGYGQDRVLGDGSAPPVGDPSDRTMNTSLQYFLPVPERHTSSIRAGVKYHDGHINYYIGPRYRYLLPLDRWTFRFTEDVIWGTINGWESKTILDLERPVGEDLFFRTSTEGNWTETVNGYIYHFSLLLRQPLDVKRALQYEAVSSFHTRPHDELTEVRFVFRYRQQVWRRWLYFEIAPQQRFPRDRGFHGVPGILFKVELLFGDIRS